MAVQGTCWGAAKLRLSVLTFFLITLLKLELEKLSKHRAWAAGIRLWGSAGGILGTCIGLTMVGRELLLGLFTFLLPSANQDVSSGCSLFRRRMGGAKRSCPGRSWSDFLAVGAESPIRNSEGVGGASGFLARRSSAWLWGKHRLFPEPCLPGLQEGSLFCAAFLQQGGFWGEGSLECCQGCRAVREPCRAWWLMEPCPGPPVNSWCCGLQGPECFAFLLSSTAV